MPPGLTGQPIATVPIWGLRPLYTIEIILPVVCVYVTLTHATSPAQSQRVRAFDAAARHQSFSRAAAELGVTHASVSRYIKNLEAELGMPLFERRHRQVALTPGGARYAEIVADALMLISLDTGTRATRNAKGRVVLESDSDLAALWLMPLLTDEVLEDLGIELELRSYPSRRAPSHPTPTWRSPGPARCAGVHARAVSGFHDLSCLRAGARRACAKPRADRQQADLRSRCEHMGRAPAAAGHEP